MKAFAVSIVIAVALADLPGCTKAPPPTSSVSTPAPEIQAVASATPLPTATPTPPPTPTDQVNRFLSSVRNNDFATIFYWDYGSQMALQRLSSDGPQFLEKQKIDEYRNESSQRYFAFTGDNTAQYSQYIELRLLFDLHPNVNIVEIDDHGDTFQAYVKFTFTSYDHAPFASWLSEGGKEQPLRETVRALTFAKPGLFQNCSTVPQTDFYFDQVPFKIWKAGVSGNPGDVMISVQTLGDERPQSATIQIGDYAVSENQFYQGAPNTINARIYGILGNMPVSHETNIPVTVTVTGEFGGKDSVSFTLPRFMRDVFDTQVAQMQFVRSPWHETLFWKDKTFAMDDPTASTSVSLSPTGPTVAPLPVANGTPMPGEQYPQTRTKLLSRDDLAGWNEAKLRYAINEMYARHGADFRDPKIKNVFSAFSWYHPRVGLSYDDAEAEFSDTEKYNVKLLGDYRNEISAH